MSHGQDARPAGAIVSGATRSGWSGLMKVTVLAALLTATTSVRAKPAGIERLAWLEGCWAVTSAERVVEEHWMSPRGGSMVGVGRTVVGEAMVEYELVVIRERGERLVYLAHPSGQPSAEFLSNSVFEGGVVFENAEHDFPQRIGYRRQGAVLEAWIEGTKDGHSRRIDFPYRRSACPGN